MIGRIETSMSILKLPIGTWVSALIPIDRNACHKLRSIGLSHLGSADRSVILKATIDLAILAMCEICVPYFTFQLMVFFTAPVGVGSQRPDFPPVMESTPAEELHHIQPGTIDPNT